MTIRKGWRTSDELKRIFHHEITKKGNHEKTPIILFLGLTRVGGFHRQGKWSEQKDKRIRGQVLACLRIIHNSVFTCLLDRTRCPGLLFFKIRLWKKE